MPRFIIDIEPGYNGDYGHAPDIDPEGFPGESIYVTDGYYTYNILDMYAINKEVAIKLIAELQEFVANKSTKAT